MKRDELAAAIREHAYLEGEFVLRSGRTSNYYLDKYRFETRPDLLAALGDHIAAAIAEHEPDAARIASPQVGAIALAAAASLSSGMPFLIVRDKAKQYGTANRIEGVFESGERVCLVEDVVTSGGAESRSACSTARRAEPTLWGAAEPVLCPFFVQESCCLRRKPPQNRMVEPKRLGC